MTTTTTRKRYAAKHGSRESMQNTRDAIRAMEPFQTSGALSGHRGNFGLRFGNWLNHDEVREFERVANHILYTVVSYNTVIAYAYRQDKDGFLPENGHAAEKVMWHLVTQKFSVTTTGHQSVVRGALSGARMAPKVPFDANDPSIQGEEWWPAYHAAYLDQPIEWEALS